MAATLQEPFCRYRWLSSHWKRPDCSSFGSLHLFFFLPVSLFVSPELFLKRHEKKKKWISRKMKLLPSQSIRVMSENVSRGTVMTKMASITHSTRPKIWSNFLVDLVSHGSLLSRSVEGKKKISNRFQVAFGIEAPHRECKFLDLIFM